MDENALSTGDTSYNFLCNGKEILMRKSIVTAERLGRYFNIIPSTICIKEEFGNRVEFPNDNGRINFVGFDDGSSFEVLGEECNSTSVARDFSPFPSRSGSPFNPTETSKSVSTIASRPWALSYNSQANTASVGTSHNKAKATVKVVFAELSPTGKPVVNPSNPRQTFIPIYNEEDANTRYLLSNTQTNLKEVNLMLVSNSGYEYTDEPGTRGTAFWKTGSRKIFAVKKHPKKRKIKPDVDKIPISVSDSDAYESEDQVQFCRKQKKSCVSNSSMLSTIEGKLIEIQSIVSEGKSELQKVLAFTKDSKVPIALKNMVKESFSCKICHTAPMKPPILASRCCGCIIGCEVCLQTWYGTGSDVFDKSCPNCRAQRGYSHTFRLVGIDEFMIKLQQLMVNGDES